MKPNFDAVPPELKDLRHWVCWRYEQTDDGKTTKVPYNPHKRRSKASVANPETWGTLEEARAAYEQSQGLLIPFDGVSFALNKELGIVGIDFDDCVHSIWINTFKCYSEITPSGSGLRILCKGNLDQLQGRKSTDHKIEIYDSGRFFTFTGNVILDLPIAERQELINLFHAEIFPPKPFVQSAPSAGLGIDEQEILDSIKRSSKRSLNFDHLYHGDDMATGSDASAGDLAFCNELRFFGASANQIDSIYRSSGRYREKWDEKHYSDGRTYGQATIEKAMQGEVKRPKGQRPQAKQTFKQGDDVPEDKPQPDGASNDLEEIKKRINKLPRETGAALEKALEDDLWFSIGCLPRAEQSIAAHALKAHCNIGKTDVKGFVNDALKEKELSPAELRDKVLESWVTAGVRAKYIAEWQEWYFYDHGVYKQALPETVQKRVNGILEGHGHKVLEYMLNDVISKLARSEGIYQERPPESQDILNIKNGLLDLNTLELKPHTPDVLTFAQAPNMYEPSFSCPKFFDFLQRVLPDDRHRKTLQEFAGYMLTSKTFLQKALYLKGPGGTGKGTLASVFKALLTGEHGHGLSVDMNIEDLNDNSASLVTAINKRMIYVSEVPGKANLIGFKKVVGEDRVNINPKYKRPFDIKLEAKLIITANTWIHTGDDNANNSIDRRLIILPFDVIPGDQHYNPNIVTDLTTEEELAGVLNWALEGWRRLRENGYRFSSNGDDGKRLEFLENSNPVITFLRERCHEDNQTKIGSSELYQNWKQWCEGYEVPESNGFNSVRYKKVGGSGHYAGSQKGFAEKCEDALRILKWKIEKHRQKEGVFWLGLKYLEP
jgi:putative DNA primase/helicase